MSVTTTRDVRYPLIVVDWTADRNRYDSRWLRLIGPADLPDLHLTDACQSWDGHGRPVTIRGTSVTMTTTAATTLVLIFFDVVVFVVVVLVMVIFLGEAEVDEGAVPGIA